MVAQLKAHGWVLAAMVFALVLTGSVEWLMGRSLLGPDGKFGLWAGDIWSSENSQRLADPYSFTHVCHGLMFYALLWLMARQMPVRYRMLIAVLLESSWEILENSPFIIDRYRQVTISLGYTGDSILNSLSDILMMSAGFLFASKARAWVAVSVFVAFELGCAFWVRDNLVLNIIMLIHPVETIKVWQSAGHPLL